ncbi:DUF2309 domain-containing protein [Scopulibacillus cellulosilyticus]|uniref:Probable inorganic carbon transporter subunit DabA n=1 Tax=Scopulibacillus cellulosilyticus TaxID=2665665 RepID=A0ABW2PTS9_9BACL
MSTISTLSENEIEQKNASKVTDIKILVSSASRVIVPLGPISTFAARHPWEGMEEQTFEEVAEWLRNTKNVELYPSVSMILSAKNRGEIDPDFLEMGLQRWLNSYPLNIPRDEAERFCRASLKLDTVPAHLLTSPELKKSIEKLRNWKMDICESSPMQPLSMYKEHKADENLAELLNHHIIKWCKLYLDNSQAGWSMPKRDEGFYQSWRRLAQYDPALSKNQRKSLKNWPQDADTALEIALSALGIPQSEIQNYLEGHLLSLPGWAGMMLWRSQQSKHEQSLLLEYLAVRISMEWALLKPYLPLQKKCFKEKVKIDSLLAAWIHFGGLTFEKWSKMSTNQQKEYLTFAYNFNEKICKRLWLEAWEQTYTDQLSRKVLSNQHVKNETKPVLAQFAFCIDVRSEPYRRYLEKAGPFETFGVAGFFGLPIEISELGSKHTHSSLPVMQKPQHKIEENTDENQLKQYQQRKQAVESLSYTFKTMKQNALPSLHLPEVSGPWLTIKMLTRSMLPRRAGSFIRNLRDSWLHKPDTHLSLNSVRDLESEIPLGFSNEDQVNYVCQTLRMMGLIKNFAPLIVICGHGSQSTNNPYSSSLDCGACGGASGGFNARVFASLCNLPKVREVLSSEGIEIPEETIFVAAEHNTTVNELKWLYVPKLSKSAQEAFNYVEEVLPKVGQQANADSVSQLPNIKTHFKNPMAEAHRFADDWSEIRPEWGLARNAAFIIGERELTQNCNLEGRVFLHNYDWKQDPDGKLLANIIAGPGTVAQWINLQYYASTVAPHFYGSGNKATQTVTAGLGVMQGVASDLLSGLPWQSVMASDDEAYHAPLRLLIVIQAPNEYVERLLNNDGTFNKKVQNGWLRLASLNPQGYWENW